MIAARARPTDAEPRLPVRSGRLLPLTPLVWSTFGAILAMVQWRCRSAPYPCGDWVEAGGISWHFFAAFGVIAAAGYLAGAVIGIRAFARATLPLLGLSLGVVWYGLPAALIHPPPGGGCPRIPVVCHDILEGSILIWTLPFVCWALARTARVLLGGRRR